MTNVYKQFYKKYLGAGFSVIPDKPRSKAPAIKDWSAYCHNQPTIDQASEWANAFPESNMSICFGPASGVIGLDFDCTDPEIVALIEGFLPVSPVEKFGMKGWTRFFRYNGEVTQSIKYNGEMVIELLSVGKKATLPPSIHPDTGEEYTWSEKSLLDVPKEELPLLPPYLFAHIQDKIRFSKPDLESTARGLISGRNSELSSLAARLISEKVDVVHAVEKLIEHDKVNNNPPLFEDISEMRQPEPYTNALAFYTNHLQSINLKHYRNKEEFEMPFIAPSSVVIPEGRKPVDRSLAHITLPRPQGTMGLMYDYILSNSFVKQPNFAFSASLALMSSIVSRKLVFQGVSPNLYMLNVAVSGAGKDAPQQCLKRIMVSLKADYLLGAGDYVSDASLMDGLATQPVRLDIIDEASGLLKSVNKGSGEHAAKMADLLCELYTCSNDKFLGRMTASEGRKGSCYRPNITLLASTTPKGLEEGLTRRSIDKGLVGRFLLFFGEHDRPAERVKNMVHPSEDLLDQAEYWLRFEAEKTGDIGGVSQKYLEVEADREANKLLEEFFLWVDTSRRESAPDNPMLPIISRMYQMLLKIALLTACSRAPKSTPIVVKSDVEFAKKVVDYYFNNMKFMVEHHIFESARDEKVVKLLRVIEQAPGCTISMPDLTKNTMHLDKRERQTIIDDLLASGKIFVYHEKVEGKKTQELFIKLL